MISPEERMQVLKMIEAGKITAEEGAKLLAVLGDAPENGEVEKSQKGQRFRILVTDAKTGKQKVNVTIPLSLVIVGMRMGARFAPGVEATDLEDLQIAIARGHVGKVMDVQDQEEGERVEIFVE